MSRSNSRSLAEGAAFQIIFTGLAIGTLGAWARFCEARRTRLARRWPLRVDATAPRER
jgi:hypothetical protein